MELIDLLIESRKKQEKYFKNYLFWARVIKKEARTLLGEVKVYVFGSILRPDEVPRDIDILIVSPNIKTTAQKSAIRAKIWKRIGMGSPFELHIVNQEEYEDWYGHFLKDKKDKIEV